MRISTDELEIICHKALRLILLSKIPFCSFLLVPLPQCLFYMQPALIPLKADGPHYN